MSVVCVCIYACVQSYARVRAHARTTRTRVGSRTYFHAHPCVRAGDGWKDERREGEGGREREGGRGERRFSKLKETVDKLPVTTC